MFSKSFAMTSLLCGAVVVSILGAAGWMRSTAQAQVPAATAAPGAREQAEMMNNLKQIMLAFHNYADANSKPDAPTQFPPAAIYGSDGQPKLSWRVALLPFLGQADLYNQFHLDEAWDSPHNKALISKIPNVYATPTNPTNAGETRIQGFVGKGAMFEGTSGVSIPSVTDGTSNTVMVALAKSPVPWTQPNDMPFGEGAVLKLLDGGDARGYFLAMGDGSVRRIFNTHYSRVKSLVTRNGGEIIDWDVFGPPTPPAPDGTEFRAAGGTYPLIPIPPGAGGMGASMGGGPTPATAPDLDARLKRLEDKLDRILQKLDAGGR